MRQRAGIVVFCKAMKRILLIQRKKRGEEYWTVPGGGLKEDESFEEGARRELAEELGISTGEMEELCTIALNDRIEKYYISYIDKCDTVEIQGEELERSNDDNIYIPTWVDVSNIPLITLLPDGLKTKLAEILIIRSR